MGSGDRAGLRVAQRESLSTSRIRRQDKEKSAEIVEGLALRGELPLRKPRVREKEIELYAEGETRQQISTLNLAEALRTFFELRHTDGYVAIISFVGGNSTAAQAALVPPS